MNVEITREGEYVIAKMKFASIEQAAEVQEELEYFEYLKIIKKSKGTQKDADELADEIKKDWWQQNKEEFIK